MRIAQKVHLWLPLTYLSTLGTDVPLAVLQTQSAKQRMVKFVERGGQTPEGERDWSAWRRMYERLEETD